MARCDEWGCDVPFRLPPKVCDSAGRTLSGKGVRAVLGRRLTLLVGIVVVALASCAADDDAAVAQTALGDDAITVGSFGFSESVLLAEIYSQALEADGYRVERAFGLGPRELVGPALSTGLIELLPEYAGSALTFRSLGSSEPSADVTTTRGGLERVLAGTDVVALAAAPAQNANTFVVTPATARRHGLATLSDLAGVDEGLVFGGPPECERRPLCLLGLQERYGLQFGDVVTLDGGGPVTHAALRAESVHVALLFTTDPSLDDYVELTDDRGLQPAENVTPLLHREVVERWGPDVVELIDGVSAALDTDTLRAMNAADAEEPGSDDVRAIAAEWLRSEGAP